MSKEELEKHSNLTTTEFMKTTVKIPTDQEIHENNDKL